MAMRIIEPTDAIEIKTLVVMAYGQPGSKKTSMAQTAENPITIDFDKGIHRAYGRKRAVQFDNYSDFKTELTKGTFKPYSSTIIDTVGRMLDFLKVEIASQPKMSGPSGLSQQGWGVLLRRFLDDMNILRSYGHDIILISHEKIDRKKEESYMRPDIQGGSYQEVWKLADLVGYTRFYNGKRYLDFNPTDDWIAKGPSGWQPLEIPDFAEDPKFMANVIASAKAEMGRMSAEGAALARVLEEKWQEWSERLAACEVPADLTSIVKADLANTEVVPAAMKDRAWKAAKARATEIGGIWDVPSKTFVPVAAKEEAPPTASAPPPPVQPAPEPPPASNGAPKADEFSKAAWFAWKARLKQVQDAPALNAMMPDLKSLDVCPEGQKRNYFNAATARAAELNLEWLDDLKAFSPKDDQPQPTEQELQEAGAA